MPMLDERPVVRDSWPAHAPLYRWEWPARAAVGPWDRERGGPALKDPEAEWERPADREATARAAVARCLGATDEGIEPLAGRSNLNVRVGGRVLRAYQRDPARALIEQALLARPWRQLEVARVLAAGPDYVLQPYLPHARLGDTAAHGAAVGRALAEIHARGYASPGLLGPDLEVVVPFTDPVGVQIRQLGDSIERWPAAARPLGARVLAFLERQAGSLRRLATEAVLLHGDFKPSNLRWTAPSGRPDDPPADRLVVFDWERAHAGARLSDIGQLLRWGPSSDFVAGFARAYRDAGGRLCTRWRDWAAVFDLFALAEAMSEAPGSRAAGDLERRMAATLAQDP